MGRTETIAVITGVLPVVVGVPGVFVTEVFYGELRGPSTLFLILVVERGGSSTVIVRRTSVINLGGIVVIVS